MKTIFLSFILIGILQIKLYSQTTQIPLEVNIKLINEYEAKLSKEKIKWAYPRNFDFIPGDSVIQKKYDIEILIRNVSSEPIIIWLMSCSWTDNFIINNNYITFERWDCDKNIPEQIKINPNEIKSLNVTLKKDIKFDYPGNSVYGYGVETTRVGLLLSQDMLHDNFDFIDYRLFMEDKSKWKIVWSNPLHLHKFNGGIIIPANGN